MTWQFLAFHGSPDAVDPTICMNIFCKEKHLHPQSFGALCMTKKNNKLRPVDKSSQIKTSPDVKHQKINIVIIE